LESNQWAKEPRKVYGKKGAQVGICNGLYGGIEVTTDKAIELRLGVKVLHTR